MLGAVTGIISSRTPVAVTHQWPINLTTNTSLLSTDAIVTWPINATNNTSLLSTNAIVTWPINITNQSGLLSTDTIVTWPVAVTTGNVPAPVANFTASVTTGTSPLVVQFTDTSTNSPTSWSWNFGNSTTSTSQNPSCTYSTAGTYTVTLTATNAGGSDAEVKTGFITVEAATNPDPYFSNVQLLLRGDNTNGSTTFTNNGYSGAFTGYGNVQNTTAEKKYGTGSIVFDGSGDYLVSNNSYHNLEGAAFTIELWVKFTSLTGQRTIISNYQSPTVGYTLQTVNDAIYFNAKGDTIAIQSAAGAVTTGVWYHLAVSGTANGTSSSIKMFLNGVQIGSTYTGATYMASATNLSIGTLPGYALYFSGYMDNVRITAGYSRYPENFTTPDETFSNDNYFSNVSLLLHSDGTNGSTTFTDISLTPKTVTAVNSTISTSVFKFGTGSAALSGSNSYLTIPTSTAFDFGTGDFCVECWIYPTNLTSYKMIIARQEPSNGMAFQLTTNGTTLGGTLRGSGGVGLVGLSGGTVVLNTWQHVALTRSGTTVNLYLNGTAVATTTSSVNLTCSRPLTIGILDDTVLSYPFTGYIDEVRITKGVARYTANFTSPSTEFSSVAPTPAPTPAPGSSTDTYYSNVSLLLHGDGTNGSTTFTDNSPTPKTVTPVATTVSTSVAKYGTGSIALNGSSSYLSIPNSTDFAFGSGDFTIECWVYQTATPSGSAIITETFQPTGYVNFTIGYGTTVGLQTGALPFIGFFNGSAWTGAVATQAQPNNEWYHIAYVRSGSTHTMYINGVSKATFTSAVAMPTGTDPILIGRRWDTAGTASYFSGYVDDVRITKGVARYTADFTPSTSAFPDQ